MGRYCLAATPLPKAIRLAVVQQAVVLLLTGLTADEGALFQVCLFAMVAFWIGFGVMWLCRGAAITTIDVMLVRWGYLPLCLISGLASEWIWRLRDITYPHFPF